VRKGFTQPLSVTTYLISAPAQNDLSPVPVIITTFILSSAPTMSIAVYYSDIASLAHNQILSRKLH
jgi:hypothetical protein